MNVIFETQIEEILEWFDFDRVLIMMRSVGWVWRENERPTKDTLINLAKKHLEYVIQNDVNSVSSGGLRASKFIDEDGEIYLSLSFDAESWSTYHE